MVRPAYDRPEAAHRSLRAFTGFRVNTGKRVDEWLKRPQPSSSLLLSRDVARLDGVALSWPTVRRGLESACSIPTPADLIYVSHSRRVRDSTITIGGAALQELRGKLLHRNK